MRRKKEAVDFSQVDWITIWDADFNSIVIDTSAHQVRTDGSGHSDFPSLNDIFKDESSLSSVPELISHNTINSSFDHSLHGREDTLKKRQTQPVAERAESDIATSNRPKRSWKQPVVRPARPLDSLSTPTLSGDDLFNDTSTQSNRNSKRPFVRPSRTIDSRSPATLSGYEMFFDGPTRWRRSLDRDAFGQPIFRRPARN